MKPVRATTGQIEHWTDRDGIEPVLVVIGGPEEAPDVIPCPTLVGRITATTADGDPVEGKVFHVAYELDEIEVAHLARGGTLWLTTWGALPIHHLEVVER